MKNDTKIVNVRFMESDLENLDMFLANKGMKRSEFIRKATFDAMNPMLVEDNLDVVRKVIKTELEAIINPKMERMIALEVKSCLSSIATNMMTAQTYTEFIDIDSQADFMEIYNKAHKLAVQEMKNSSTSSLEA
jgi:hypothetical protein